ncbi:MAG: nickel-dependent hydrogenase large subunit [Desulfitobacteriaceae bacterium]|nr:nickel-dependent hydrogenase large subunit [Desulfitobacteriaceae bacterium]
MSKEVVNPLTRISGFLEIIVEIENGIIVEARNSGVLFRGFEIMLNGRPPLDAIYFTQRICGICSTAHSMAATLALEEALNVIPLSQGRALRDLVHACEFLQNHLRHFYQYTVPDFVDLPKDQCLFNSANEDLRLPKEINDRITENYFRSIDFSRAAHEMLALLAGKAPHDHGIFVGGITVRPTIDKIIKFTSLLKQIRNFVDGCMIPDATAIGQFYSDYFGIGKGYGNLLTYGAFDDITELPDLYVKPAVSIGERKESFEKNQITEYLNYSWYQGPSPQEPSLGTTDPDINKESGYSWTKAPRYGTVPCEVGPLARMILSGEYQNGISVMDRTIARVLEVRKIIIIMETILNFIKPDLAPQGRYEVPQNAEGAGLVDTTRGALGHWLKIDGQVISHYQVVTPSAWNLSPRDGLGQRGVVEEALVGTPVQNPDNPVEIGRIVRSFDPCVSCSTHVYTPRGEKKFKVV